MKKFILLILILPLVSCSSRFFELPLNDEKTELNNIEISGIPEKLDQLIQEDGKIQIITSSYSQEQFDFLKYIVPLLHDRNRLDLGLWFLEGNSDDEILSYLTDSTGSLSASTLLFHSNPVLCGYKEYEDFIEFFKNFYTELDNPESVHLTGSEEAYIKVDKYMTDMKQSDRTKILIHTPLSVGSYEWQLPFKGKIYYMMINEWPLSQFGIINIHNSILGNLFLTGFDEENQITAEDRADYLLLMGVPQTYRNLRPINDFINEGNVSDALQFFPKQIIREKLKPASYLVNRKISRIHRKTGYAMKKAFDEIYSLFPASK